MRLEELKEAATTGQEQLTATYTGDHPVPAQIDPEKIYGLTPGEAREQHPHLEPRQTDIHPGDTGYWEQAPDEEGKLVGWFVRADDSARVKVKDLPKNEDDLEVVGYHGSYSPLMPVVRKGEVRDPRFETILAKTKHEDPTMKMMRQLMGGKDPRGEPRSKQELWDELYSELERRRAQERTTYGAPQFGGRPYHQKTFRGRGR